MTLLLLLCLIDKRNQIRLCRARSLNSAAGQCCCYCCCCWSSRSMNLTRPVVLFDPMAPPVPPRRVPRVARACTIRANRGLRCVALRGRLDSIPHHADTGIWQHERRGMVCWMQHKVPASTSAPHRRRRCSLGGLFEGCALLHIRRIAVGTQVRDSNQPY